MARIAPLLLLVLAALLWRSLRRVRVVEPEFTPAPDRGWHTVRLDDAPWEDSSGVVWADFPALNPPPQAFGGLTGPYARPDWCAGPVMPHRRRWVGDALGGMIDG